MKIVETRNRRTGQVIHWTPEYIKEVLTKNDKALVAGMLRIYSHQTDTEQKIKHVTCTSYMGYTKPDASTLSKLSQICIRAESMSRGCAYMCLNSIQLQEARERMPKYAGQLFKYLCAQYPANVKDVPKTKIVKGTGQLVFI